MSGGSGMRIVVIGASAAGLKAAARARRLLPQADIVVFDAREFISYGACGLPFYLSGDLDNLDRLRETQWQAIRDAEFFARVKGLDVRCGRRATALDLATRTVTVESVDAGAAESVGYDRLVIATGAAPRLLGGITLGDAVTCFHVPEESQPLRRGLETGQIGSAVVIGGGFVGVEVAVALADMWGCAVTLLEAEDRLLPHLLDADMSRLVAAELARHDVVVKTGVPVAAAHTVGEGAEVTAGGETFAADRAVVALGVVPQIGFAAAAGLVLGASGALAVDEQLRTSDHAVFAAGDCVEVVHRLTRQPCYVPLGSLANRQGRVVGDNLAADAADAEAAQDRPADADPYSSFGAVVGSSCLKVFDLNVAATGLSETAAAHVGLSADAVWGTFHDVAHYYPEPGALYLKVVYERGSGRLLGLQAVGPGEAVKRVDVFASLLQRDGKLRDLLDLEFCYAPPYNAALDPLHGLGCAALNREEAGVIGVGPFVAADGRAVIDVRSADEAAARPWGSPEALHIPSEQLRARLSEIPTDRPLLIVCEKGPRSAELARWLLAQERRDVVYLAGGMALRSQAGSG
jgi:NADPH-dependent 2,4-dienoyl-CoA reductase/sulfur reductase-like enzyme/rhodanese-related sulfurtransferase